MRGDQNDYDPMRDQYAEHDTRDDGAGLVVRVVIAACITLGFALGIAIGTMAGRMIFG